MAKVIWTEPALRDLERIFEYLARTSQSADLAERICLELLDAAYDRLSRTPRSGALVQEAAEHGAREIYRHSYRIIYVQRGEACYVVRCIHSSRDLAQHLDPDSWPQVE